MIACLLQGGRIRNLPRTGCVRPVKERDGGGNGVALGDILSQATEVRS
jgi:hypothetical protein